MYLTQGLHRSLQQQPQRMALCHSHEGGERRYRFAELHAQVARRAAALQATGIQRGDRVAWLSPNDDHLIIGLLACWWLGAVACPMNTRWSAAELRHGVIDCGAKLLLVNDAMAALAQPLAEVVPLETMQAFAQRAAALAPIEDSRTGGEALACILYTGGTTGQSKGVVLTHANFWAAMMARGAELNNPPEGVSLMVAPLFHVGGLSRMLGQLIVGGVWITLQQFRADVVLAAIMRHGISDLFVVPTMLQMMLDEPGFDAARVQSLNRIAFGAAPMPPALLERALATWPQAVFFQAYGMTESAGALCINQPRHFLAPGADAARIHAVGRAGLGAEIRVVGSDGRDCPPGEVGEIIVRGPMVMQGYWQQPQQTAEVLRNGWLHTGDGGRMDQDGYLYMADRLKDMVISGGENIYPAEVEAVLSRHPDVAMVAVIGVPHAQWGESVHAVVVPKGGVPANAEAFTAELQHWCRQQLAHYKCPKSVAFVATLPLTAAGKVHKTTLRASWRARDPGDLARQAG